MIVFAGPSGVVKAHLGDTGGLGEDEADSRAVPVRIGPGQLQFEFGIRGDTRYGGAPVEAGSEAQFVERIRVGMTFGIQGPPGIEARGSGHGREYP